MKITLKTLAIATSLCSALVLSPVSFAGCDGSGNQAGFNKGQQTSEKRFAKLTEKLDLTEEQQTKVKALQAANQAENIALKSSMRAYHEQVKTLVDSGDFTDVEFTTLYTNNQDVFLAKALIRAKHKAAMRAILTDEQLVTFDTMKGKKGKRGKKGNK